LNTHRDNVSSKIEGVLKKTREIEKELAQLKAKLASQASSDIETQAQEIEGIKVLAQVLEGADTKTLRETLDKLKDKLGSAAIVLASSQGEKVTIVAGVTKDQTNRIKAGDLVNSVATKVGGKGGGRPDMAQAGGNNPAALEAALKAVPDWVKGQL
jgi:alanyl-tRNA synthetase